MDLGTVQQRLTQGNHYTTLYQVGADVRRIWTNCMTYNQENSDFYQLAEVLAKKWDTVYQQILVDLPDAKVPEVSLNDRRSFAKSLYGLTKDELGKVLVQIEATCPDALVRNATEDEVELNVDVLPGPVLQELTQLVAAASKKGGGSNKKRKK